MPNQTLVRLSDRLERLRENMDIRIFPADEVVPGLFFSTQEIKDFGVDGRSMIVAVSDFDILAKAIPAVEVGITNYIHLTHSRAVKRLDPFAQDTNN